MTSAARKSGPPTESNRGFLVIVVGVIVVGLLAVAVFATNRGSDETDVPQTAAVDLSGGSLAPLPEGVSMGTVATDPVVGSTAPTLTATDFEGNEVTIGPDGRAKAVYFLAHWCPHCQAEVPVVQAWLNAGNLPDDVDMYAVSTLINSARGNYPPEDWLVGEGWTVPTLTDDTSNTVSTSYGMTGTPFYMVLDGNNTNLVRVSGQIGIEGLEQLVALAQSAAG